MQGVAAAGRTLRKRADLVFKGVAAAGRTLRKRADLVCKGKQQQYTLLETGQTWYARKIPQKHKIFLLQ